MFLLDCFNFNILFTDIVLCYFLDNLFICIDHSNCDRYFHSLLLHTLHCFFCSFITTKVHTIKFYFNLSTSAQESKLQPKGYIEN